MRVWVRKTPTRSAFWIVRSWCEERQNGGLGHALDIDLSNDVLILSSGIYRQAGLESKIKQLLIECLEDPFTTSLNHDTYTEHDVASALKRFLRQLETPMLGTRQNYQAWLRSTVDKTMTGDYLIPYYRALLKDLKQRFPTHYATLRTMLMHIHTVAMLAETNGMTMSNLVSTFAPCLISQTTPTSINWNNVVNGRERKMSVDEIDMQSARYLLENEPVDRTASPSLTKLKRNQSFNCKYSVDLSHFSWWKVLSRDKMRILRLVRLDVEQEFLSF